MAMKTHALIVNSDEPLPKCTYKGSATAAWLRLAPAWQIQNKAEQAPPFGREPAAAQHPGTRISGRMVARLSKRQCEPWFEPDGEEGRSEKELNVIWVQCACCFSSLSTSACIDLVSGSFKLFVLKRICRARLYNASAFSGFLERSLSRNKFPGNGDSGNYLKS